MKERRRLVLSGVLVGGFGIAVTVQNNSPGWIKGGHGFTRITADLKDLHHRDAESQRRSKAGPRLTTD